MDWEPTPEQRSAFQQQTFIEELIKLRSPQSKSSADPKPGWQRFLESTGGAALITVVLGTGGGYVLTHMIQSFEKSQQARQLSMSEYIKGEHDTVKAVFDLVGQCVAASENLSTLTTNAFNPEAFPQGEQRNHVLAQKQTLRDDFNKLDQQWRSSRETLTLNMRYYHSNDPAVSTAWDRTRDSLTSYIDCEHRWYIDHLGSFVDESVAVRACDAEQQSLHSALIALSEALAKNRLYQWGEPKS